MNDFAAALRDLNESGIRYVIVGGLALIRHGAVRTTKLAAGGVLALRTPHCLVDFLSEQLLPGAFDDVLARADVRRIDGVEAPICSFADLVAMKRATGRGTDRLDLERLTEAHGELPDAAGPRP